MAKKAEIQTQNGEISITQAKGRPMLVWVGKRPLTRISPYPAQHIETSDPTGAFGKPPLEPELWQDWPTQYPKGGLLFHGDNKEVLAHLLANGFRGKVNLVYIDPPFDSGADYVRKITLRGVKGTAKIEGESYTLGEQIQYTDIWVNDNYFQFLYERFQLLKELLSETGHILVQADDKRGHYIKIILDEIFGPENYVNDIVWHKGREGGGGTDQNPPLPTEYQNIYLYAKSKKNRRWNPPRGPYKPATLQGLDKDEKGWFYTRGRMSRKPRDWEIAAGVSKKTYVSNDPKESKDALIKRLTSPGAEYVLLWDIWNSEIIKNSTATNYPTEKPEELLKIIVSSATIPGDIVLDCFIGSGTTAAVAQKLGRRWVGCDINKGAIQTTVKRIREIIDEQTAESTTIKIQKAQKKITDDKVDTKIDTGLHPSLAFTVWRVNDYDLQIQHNEAVQLACDIIGIQRIRTDSFFEGILGKQPVKIIPFGHPLNPLDLEEIKRELESRPEEERNVIVVCLGMELAAKSWVDDWNRLRKGKDAINKIDVIELRTDERYGKFIKHEPAQAQVTIQRKSNKIFVEINDFVSPTIIQRLSQSQDLVKPVIKSWQSMVDYVMIDSAYDGKIFNISLSDLPEKKDMVVEGKYEIPAPKGKTTIAIKIVDMLGEEILITKEV